VIVLDTCTLIWLASDPRRLGAGAVAVLDTADEIHLSDATVWEICLKWQVKKLELPSPPRTWVSEQARAWDLTRLPIEPEHLYRAVELPELHRDPFDRLLVAQTLACGGKLVTPDPAIRQYPVSVVW
jgi:PIN domain nuclease of toxin-antitoxin system